MLNTLKYLLFVLIVIAFVSCNKDEIKRKIEKKIETEAVEEESDTTTLTPAEAFSQALVVDILDFEDEDLQIYMEDEIYPLVKNSNKVTIDNISSSLFLLQYTDNGIQKNILIQKYYNPAKDEFFFEKREVQNDAIKQFVK